MCNSGEHGSPLHQTDISTNTRLIFWENNYGPQIGIIHPNDSFESPLPISFKNHTTKYSNTICYWLISLLNIEYLFQHLHDSSLSDIFTLGTHCVIATAHVHSQTAQMLNFFNINNITAKVKYGHQTCSIVKFITPYSRTTNCHTHARIWPTTPY